LDDGGGNREQSFFAISEENLCQNRARVLLAPGESSEELKECVRKVKEAGLIPERDERTVKQVKNGGKGKPCGALPR